MELELEGVTVGYESEGCQEHHDHCLTKADVEYLVEMKREEAGIGGFRRMYPTPIGDRYTRFIDHLRSKFPSGSQTGTYRLHRLLTALARLSKIETDNAINDPNFKG